MNDPFGRAAQSLTDALLQLDLAISLAEANVAAARQIGLPEAPELAARLPALTQRAREFLASVPVASQPQRWGEQRRLLDQAVSFQPLFAPYVVLGHRVTAARQAIADQAERDRAAAAAAIKAKQTFECNAALETARRRYSALRQTVADMQLQRGSGFDDSTWLDAIRTLQSIIAAQDVRISSAAASIRDGRFADAQAALDQSLGELQAALDLGSRARAAAEIRAGAAPIAVSNGITVPMPELAGSHVAPPTLVPFPDIVSPPLTSPPPTLQNNARALTLIDVRNGTVFRCDGTVTLIGRGLGTANLSAEPYINLSWACDPGEAEEFGVSRRHAEIGRLDTGFAIRDKSSTNGTRIKRSGQTTWMTLMPDVWTPLLEGDVVQFGLLECSVSLVR